MNYAERAIRGLLLLFGLYYRRAIATKITLRVAKKFLFLHLAGFNLLSFLKLLCKHFLFVFGL